MKKFARTMDEAFPFGVDYGCAIKIAHKPNWLEKSIVAIIWASVFASVLVLALAYFDVLVK